MITKIVFIDQLNDSGLSPSIKNNRDTALCCLSDKQYQQIFLTVDQNNFLKQNTISIILRPL